MIRQFYMLLHRSINVTAVPNSMDSNLSFLPIESVDNTVILHSQTELSSIFAF